MHMFWKAAHIVLTFLVKFKLNKSNLLKSSLWGEPLIPFQMPQEVWRPNLLFRAFLKHYYLRERKKKKDPEIEN